MLPNEMINLEGITCLLVDDNVQCLDILGVVVSSFGVANIVKCTSVREAKEVLSSSVVDIVLTDAQMPGEDGYALIEWLRRHAAKENRFIPAIILTGHTRQSQITAARDRGAHFAIAKPITPRVILERIFWVARDERMTIETKTYCGPDRRFKQEGPPPGKSGRRRGDEDAGPVGPAGRNLDQDLINAMVKPAKVMI